MDLIIGILFGLFAQIITFLQLQGNIKYHLYDKFPILTLMISIPIGFLYLRSVEHLVTAYNGEIWPSRLIGFAVGIIVFTSLSYFMFKEPINQKTIICLLLSLTILLVQIFWK